MKGSFHQGDVRFGQSAGKQCTCCSLFSLAFLLVKTPGSWDVFDLDYILEQGDKIDKELNKNSYLMFSELPHEIFSLDITFDFEFLGNKFRLLHYNSVCGTLIDSKLHSDSDGLRILVKGISFFMIHIVEKNKGRVHLMELLH